MAKHTFNNGKAYHGSSAVMGGKLKGATAETDYFYFFCPICPDEHLMRILDYQVHTTADESPYEAAVSRKVKKSFALVFQLYCENCKHVDFVKVSSFIGWQGGKYADVMARYSVPATSS